MSISNFEYLNIASSQNWGKGNAVSVENTNRSKFN